MTLLEIFVDKRRLLARLVGRAATIERLQAEVADYKEVVGDMRRLTRDLDIALHGEEGAAKQASLCDLIGPARQMRVKRKTTMTHHDLALRICLALETPLGGPCGEDVQADRDTIQERYNILLNVLSFAGASLQARYEWLEKILTEGKD